MQIETVLQNAMLQLNAISYSPMLDAELLLMHVLDLSRSYLYTHSKKQIDESAILKYTTLIQKRKEGFPIAYLLEKKAFWSFELNVTQDTLIPRPETELIIELVLKNFNLLNPCKLLDMGTGSGAIALAIASEKPAWNIDAVDISMKALKVANKNASELNLKNINFIKSHWFQNVIGHYDIIVSNPPYLSSNDPYLQGDIRYEPKRALVAKENGLEALNILTREAKKYLKPNGAIFLEHGADQGSVVREMLHKNSFEQIETVCDLSGHERVTFSVF